MKSITPANFPDKYDPNTKNWHEILASPDQDLISADFNSMQSIIAYRIALLASTLLNDGSYTIGGIPTILQGLSSAQVSISSGNMWANQTFHPVPAGTISITGIGTEVIGVLITPKQIVAGQTLTATTDPDIYDPASLSEDYGVPGCPRSSYNYTFTLNNSLAVPICTFQDGQLVQVVGNNAFLNLILSLMAQRTYETSGSYSIDLPNLGIVDTSTDLTTNPTHIKINLTGGVGYVQGNRVVNSSSNTAVNVLRPLTGQARLNEPFTYLTVAPNYTVDNPPVLSVDNVVATEQSGSIPMLKGVLNGADGIPTPYQPVLDIVSITDATGNSPYRNGIDFVQSGNFVQWIIGGNQPPVGGSYTLVVQTEVTMTKGIRQQAIASPETHILTKSSTAAVGGNFTETVTVGGTLTVGDQLKLTFTCSALSGSPLTVSYTTLTGNSTTAMATGLAAAVNANAILSAALITATSTGAIVTITYPVSLLNTPTTPLTFSKSIVGTGTETLTLAQGFIGDVFKLTFTSTAITGSPLLISYTAIANDTSRTIAAALSAAINANSALTAAGITSTVFHSVVTISYSAGITGGLAIASSLTGTGTETITVAAAAVTAQLSYGTLIAVTSVANGSTIYVQGTDYSVTPYNGQVTWLSGTVPTVALTFNYQYWAHTTEGDYVGRDSWQDSSGNVLYESSPTYDAAGNVIDYTQQISFITTSGATPVNNTTVLINYTYTLGRQDVLVWDKKGLFSTLTGIPSSSPQPPVVSSDYMGIATLNLPPEAFAANVTYTLFDNQTLLVTDLRHMKNEIETIQFNEAQFQLASDTNNIPTTTDKIGIFADPLVDLHLMDVSNAAFALSLNPLSHQVALPRTAFSMDLTSLMTGSGCILYGNNWLPTYTDSLLLYQPFGSESDQINGYGGLNTLAQISVAPGVDISAGNEYTEVINSADYGNVEISFTPNAWATGQFHGTTGYAPYGQGLIAESALLQSLSSSTALANRLNVGTTALNLLATQVAVDPSWVSVISNTGATASGVVSSNPFVTILANVQVYVNPAAAQQTRTFTITGKGFLPNEPAIDCTLNERALPLPLTPVSGSGTSVNSTRTYAVNAKADGTWKATVTLPAGLTPGSYTLLCQGRQASNLNLMESIAQTTVTTGAFVRATTLNIAGDFSFAGIVTWDVWRAGVGYVETLGTAFIPGGSSYNQNYWLTYMNSLSFGPLLYQLAYPIAIGQSVYGQTLTEAEVVAALAIICGYASCFYPKPSTEELTVVADAMLAHPGDYNGMCNALIEVGYWWLFQRLAHDLAADPLAQSFDISDNNYWIDQVGLFFTNAGTAPVVVNICTLDEGGQPTRNYLASTTIQPSQYTADPTMRTETVVKFPQPVYLSKDNSYCIVLLCNDSTTEVAVGQLGATDLVNGLIVKDPTGGSFFVSANAQSWAVQPGKFLKFKLYSCNFTAGTSYINFGQVTFPSSAYACLLSLNVPYGLPDDTTAVQFQFSYDGLQWNSVSPLAEFNLNGAYQQIYLRLALTCSAKTAPYVLNAAQLLGYLYQASGSYVHRAFAPPSTGTVDEWLDCTQPGNTTIGCQVNFNDGAGWINMTENTGNAFLAADDIHMTRHWSYTVPGGIKKNSVQTRVNLASILNYVSPNIMNVRVIAT